MRLSFGQQGICDQPASRKPGILGEPAVQIRDTLSAEELQQIRACAQGNFGRRTKASEARRRQIKDDIRAAVRSALKARGL